MVSMLDLKNALFEGGVVGAGGAGFPTHAKLSDQADTVILNCAECEPLIKVCLLYTSGVMLISPLVVSSCPERIFKNVDFPAPLAPMRP